MRLASLQELAVRPVTSKYVATTPTQGHFHYILVYIWSPCHMYYREV